MCKVFFWGWTQLKPEQSVVIHDWHAYYKICQPTKFSPMPGGAALCCDIASDIAAAPLGQLFGHCRANVFVSAQRWRRDAFAAAAAVAVARTSAKVWQAHIIFSSLVWPKLKVIYARKSWRAKMPEYSKLYEIYIRACRTTWTSLRWVGSGEGEAGCVVWQGCLLLSL